MGWIGLWGGSAYGVDRPKGWIGYEVSPQAGAPLKQLALCADWGRMDGLKHVLLHSVLGVPSRSLTAHPLAGSGRTQTPFGRWWSRHPRWLKALSVVALAWIGVYLSWRIGWSLHGANLWVGVPLLVAELYGVWSLAILTWFGWPAVRTRPAGAGAHSVDIYVCTYDEPAAVLEATLTGCAAITHPHTTYLLDDGRREEIAALAAEFDALYLTRSDNAHAKAGNINAALPRTGGDLVLVLDADHVPLPGVLDALVPYFSDPKVVLVQTPHDFYNHDSVQHYEVGRHEQSVFFSVIMPGKDRHDAAFWCGSGAVIRREPLIEVGGVATETIAEDFHTTIKLQRAGWKSRYHDEVLIQGLAPHDLGGYLLQRDRWARGNLAVFATRESPLRARGLTPAQRLSYFASLAAYLAGPMRLLMLGTLAAVLWSGQLPLRATAWQLALLWAPATALSLLTGAALCRGYQRSADTTHFELCTAEIFLRALRCAIRPGHTRFKVTPKHGVDLGGVEAIGRLHLVTALTAAISLGLLARIAQGTGLEAWLPRLHGIAFWAVPLFALYELRRLLRTLALVGTRRQLRADYRVPLEASVAVTALGGGATTSGVRSSTMLGHTRDITPGGIQLELPAALEPGTAIRTALPIPNLTGGVDRCQLDFEIVACRRAGATWIAGARAVGWGPEARRHVLEYCYVLSPLLRLRGAAPTPELVPHPLGVLPSVPSVAAAAATPATAPTTIAALTAATAAATATTAAPRTDPLVLSG